MEPGYGFEGRNILPTHPSNTIPEPWLSFLRELDSAVQEEVRLDCMGGASRIRTDQHEQLVTS